MGGDVDTGGDEGVWNSLRFRCLFFTRTAVALVVTVLAAIVVVKAVGLILHPKKLQLTIAPGNVYVQRYNISQEIGGTGNEYIFRFYLEAKNPSDRVFIYYSNITVGLYIETDKLFASFDLTPPSISLSQQEQQELLVHGSADEGNVTRNIVDEKLFKKDGQKMEGAVMTLDGIITENTDGIIKKDRHANFYCGSVAVINSKELPQPQSDTHRWKCGLAIL